MRPCIYDSQNLKVALVIGTYRSQPYVDLQLESLKRHGTRIPILVHDDCGHKASDLQALCNSYSATLVHTNKRLGHLLGDISAFYHGFRWAKKLEVDILVKFSRRFIPLYDWLPELRRLAHATQYPTYGRRCIYTVPLRTDCVAFHVASWSTGGVINSLRNILNQGRGVCVERMMHGFAVNVFKNSCIKQEIQGAANVPPFADWDIMSDARRIPRTNVLWHAYTSPKGYWQASQRYGFNYAIDDFRDL